LRKKKKKQTTYLLWGFTVVAAVLCFSFLSQNHVSPSPLETVLLCAPVKNKLVNKTEITYRLGFFIFIF